MREWKEETRRNFIATDGVILDMFPCRRVSALYIIELLALSFSLCYLPWSVLQMQMFHVAPSMYAFMPKCGDFRNTSSSPAMLLTTTICLSLYLLFFFPVYFCSFMTQEVHSVITPISGHMLALGLNSLLLCNKLHQRNCCSVIFTYI